MDCKFQRKVRSLMQNLLKLIGTVVVASSVLSSCGYIDEHFSNLGSQASTEDLFRIEKFTNSHNNGKIYLASSNLGLSWVFAGNSDPNYFIEFFQSSQCEGEAVEDFESENPFHLLKDLSDASIYSVRVTPFTEKRRGRALCSPDIVVDLQAPTVSFVSPSTETYSAGSSYSFSFSANDVGLSGLKTSDTFLVEVFGAENCSGSSVSSEKRASTEVTVAESGSLTRASLRVTAYDFAGNASTPVCSNTVFFSSNAPTLALADPTETTPGYTNQALINVAITDDIGATKWCLSEVQTTRPASDAAPCNGSSAGGTDWATTRPTSLTLNAPDGLKTVYLWIADGSGYVRMVFGTSTITLDTTAPTVTSVTSSSADSTYNIADTINVQTLFNEPLLVTGTPQITLETGAFDLVANYTSTLASTLNFSATVQNNQNSPDLNYQSTTALVLNGGTITDLAGNPATLTLPALASANSLASNKNIVIADNQNPSAPSSWTMAPADGSLSNDNTPVITVLALPGEVGSSANLFTDSTCSTGIGSTATISGVGTSQIASITYATGGAQDGLKSYWGRITDAAGNQSPCAAIASYTLDTVPPTVLSVTSTRPDGKYLIGAVIDLQVTFSENIVVIGTPRILSNLTPVTYGDFVSATSGTSTLAFRATVPSTVADQADFGYSNTTSLITNGGSLRDAAGNNAVLTLPNIGSGDALQDVKDIQIVAGTFISQKISDGDGATIPRIDNINELHLNTDETRAYVISGGIVSHFNRNTTTGALSYQSQLNIGNSYIHDTLKISPENPSRHIYTAGGGTSSTTIYQLNIDAVTGALTLASQVAINTTTPANCVGPFRPQIVPTGEYLVLSCIWSQALLVFQRDTVTGELTLLHRYDKDSPGFPATASEFYMLGMSPDGKNFYLYITDPTAGSVLVTSLNSTNGELSVLQNYTPMVRRHSEGKQCIAFSPGGDGVYVSQSSASQSNQLTHFQRNTTTGELTFTETIGSYLGASTFAISPDGKLYVDAMTHHSHRTPHFNVFLRNLVSGALSLVTQWVSWHSTTAWGQSYIHGVTFDSASEHLYMTSRNTATISHYSVDTTTGAIALEENIVTGSGAGYEFLGYPGGVTLDQTESFAYVFAAGDSAINIFQRNTTTGELTIDKSVVAGRDGFTGITQVQEGIIDSTNQYLYACSGRVVASRFYSGGPSSVTVIQRDTVTGDLIAQLQDVTTGLTTTQGDCVELYLSPVNEAYLYVVMSDQVAIYSRDVATGLLTHVSSLKDYVLKYAAFSPDMKHLYWIEHGENRIFVYERNSATGLLTLVSTLPGISPLPYYHWDGRNSIAISPDGAYLYLVYNGFSGSPTSRISSYTRDTVSGEITFLRDEHVTGVHSPGALGASDATIHFSADGKVLYQRGGSDIFKRNPADGSLLHVGRIDQCSSHAYRSRSSVIRTSTGQFYCTGITDYWNPLVGHITSFNLPSLD